MRKGATQDADQHTTATRGSLVRNSPQVDDGGVGFGGPGCTDMKVWVQVSRGEGTTDMRRIM
jgi:hypothetical protein